MHYRAFSFVLAALLLGSLYRPQTALAQPVQPNLPSIGPVTTEEKLLLERTVLSDPRIRAAVGEGRLRIVVGDIEIDKVEAEVFLRGGAAPARRVRVIAVNPLTNQASRAVVSLTDARVLSFENFPASDVPFTSEEANQALALAKSDPAVQRAIGDHLDRYQILESGSEGRVPWVAQVLPMRSTDPRDLCSVDRCVDIIFRTESGYLPFRAHVDLTIGAVELRGGGRHR